MPCDQGVKRRTGRILRLRIFYFLFFLSLAQKNNERVNKGTKDRLVHRCRPGGRREKKIVSCFHKFFFEVVMKGYKVRVMVMIILMRSERDFHATFGPT